MISCPWLLSPQECDEGAPGWCVYFCHCPSRVLREDVLFGPTLAVLPCPLRTPLGALGGSLGLQPRPRFVCRCTHVCSLSSVHTHLYTRLQPFLGISTRWWLQGLRQGLAALHSFCDLVTRAPCCPALGSPGLPSSVPSQRTGRARWNQRTPVRAPACLGGREVPARAVCSG